MKIPIWQVDAFASAVFAGNPAAVCELGSWLDDRVLQNIAAENNLSETAFLVRNATGFDLRWFTPTTEVELCGHATLAAAKVLFDRRGWPEPEIRFQTRRRGVLTVARQGGLFVMDFPALPVQPMATPAGLAAALGAEPRQVLASTDDWLAVMDGEETVRNLKPDLAAVAQYGCRCLVPTARGTSVDFVSRAFAPRFGLAGLPGFQARRRSVLPECRRTRHAGGRSRRVSGRDDYRIKIPRNPAANIPRAGISSEMGGVGRGGAGKIPVFGREGRRRTPWTNC